MGAECSCKITPWKGICTWLAMGFPGTTTLPDNKSRFLANFAKGSIINPKSSIHNIKILVLRFQSELTYVAAKGLPESVRSKERASPWQDSSD